MTSWNEGYVVDINYTYGYYPELNPLRANIPLLYTGFAPPAVSSACELGFGQGLSINLNAAASSSHWFGNDFNPSQVAFAQELSNASGCEAKLYDDSFVDFVHRKDLPEFDYIGIHGIWSWISKENRAALVDFIQRKLKVGGIAYVSYNVFPGWTSGAPLRYLLSQHGAIVGNRNQDSIAKLENAFNFLDEFLSTKPKYFVVSPETTKRFDSLKKSQKNYLSHEYINRDWRPMYFSEIHEQLSSAKLSFACSANYLDAVDMINLTPEQISFLSSIPDVSLRQTLRDYCVNQQFRKDYWIKGPRKITGLERVEALRAQRIALLKPASTIKYTTIGSLGECNLNEQIYAPIIHALSDHEPKSIGAIEKIVQNKDINLAHIVEAILILCGDNTLAPAQDEQSINKSRKSAKQLNNYIMKKSLSVREVAALASPVLAGGIGVDSIHQLFLLCLNNGKKQPAEWAQFANEILLSQNQRLLKDAKPFETGEEQLAELTRQANEFSQNSLPIIKAMQIL